MSDSQPTTGDDHVEDIPPTNEEERTHPTEEILNALAQINTQSIPTLTTSQDTVLSESNEQSQDALPPPETPPSEWDSLRAQLTERPTDEELWRKFIDHAEASRDYDLAIKTYEIALEKYPNNVGRPSEYLL